MIVLVLPQRHGWYDADKQKPEEDSQGSQRQDRRAFG